MTTRADELASAVEQLAGACGEPIDRALVYELADRCGWGARPTTAPLLPSGISHGVPWGLSLAIERGGIELRLFVEAQADPPSQRSYWDAAANVTELAAEHGADLGRLERMLEGMQPLRLWHAVALTPRPRWHAYLCTPDNETARGALARAGVAPPVLRPQDRITMTSLDLTEAKRVKAYVLMPDASLDDLAVHSPDARRFGEAMLGEERPIWWLAAISSTRTALHFGVPRHLDEPTATQRIRELLRSFKLPTEAWERARGPHHFVSFQRRDNAPRVTLYFLPEVQR